VARQVGREKRPAIAAGCRVVADDLLASINDLGLTAGAVTNYRLAVLPGSIKKSTLTCDGSPRAQALKRSMRVRCTCRAATSA